MSTGIILIDGTAYHADRPAECMACYFWKNRLQGCCLKEQNCYYLAKPSTKYSKCRTCAFCRNTPCVYPGCFRETAASVLGGNK